jgi:NAD(P)-dependent dehydrogenase (short-subunit alcohol dehydrogenase family)
MQKLILITGSTDRIGLETARTLSAKGHNILLHGRNPAKLDAAKQIVGGDAEGYVADLSKMADVEELARSVTAKHDKIDVLINNAGVFKTSDPLTPDGLDVLCGWLPICKDYFDWMTLGRVQSCVRPVDAVF